MRHVDLTATADDGLPLSGTLTLPAGVGKHPAVLLLHGSGRLDRDANTGKIRMDLGPLLAEALAKNGITALRYDRRSVSATPGDWHATGFTGNRDDAAAALRALAEHPDIQADAIGLVGHSEGAVHAMSLAPRSSAPCCAPSSPATPRLRCHRRDSRPPHDLGVRWAR